MFIDRADVFVKAGDGGDGCNSFCSIKGLKRRQDGGDGGKGGDIVLIADKNVQTLVDFYFRKHFRADKGSNGSSNHKKGANAADNIQFLRMGAKGDAKSPSQAGAPEEVETIDLGGESEMQTPVGGAAGKESPSPAQIKKDEEIPF